MKTVNTVTELKDILKAQKEEGMSIGFVPTMGALHKGHLSLVKKASKLSDFIVVSIFVNPNQFNNKEDLKNYPRTIEDDLKKLKSTACHLVFIPSVDEIYPQEDTRIFDFGNLGKVLEGQFRPGHFNGVAQVVSRLFDMVQPNQAFFGLKDFQQLAIIKNMVHQLNLNIEIVPCPIIREDDGMAMSSRNARLSPTERENAVVISQTLFEATKKAKSNTVEDVKQWVCDTINTNPHLEIEYFDIVDDIKMNTITLWDPKINKVGCIAVNCNKVRLIDNVIFE